MPKSRPPRCAAWSIGERRARKAAPQASKATMAQQAEPAEKAWGITFTTSGRQSIACGSNMQNAPSTAHTAPLAPIEGIREPRAAFANALRKEAKMPAPKGKKFKKWPSLRLCLRQRSSRNTALNFYPQEKQTRLTFRVYVGEVAILSEWRAELTSFRYYLKFRNYHLPTELDKLKNYPNHTGGVKVGTVCFTQWKCLQKKLTHHR